jgi:hypothetical protein
MFPWFKAASILVGVGINPSWCRLSKYFITHMVKLVRGSGIKFTVKYLKTCSVLIQQAGAGHCITDTASIAGARVAVRAGLPAFLPKLLRNKMKSSSLATRWVLTILSIFRDIQFPGTEKLNSITSPRTTPLHYEEKVLYSYIECFTKSFTRKVPHSLFEFSQRNSHLFSIWKSSPNCHHELAPFSTHPLAVHCAAHALVKNGLDKKVIQMLDLMGLSSAVTYLEEFINLPLPKGKANGMSKLVGRLGLLEEAAGKVRVFAFVDPFTQWALFPFHRYLFKILNTNKMDGTFDQLKPLRYIPKGVPLYSLDLSSATDRLPITLQENLVCCLVNTEFSELWQDILISRGYGLPDGGPVLHYATGQPMGALSSWAMLAYTHHFIVQCAAWIVGVCPKGVLFKEYAVLGDDIVIWNSSVAKQYLRIINHLGVECNLSKSILSPKGLGLEFAKKTFHTYESKLVNVSPIPFREICAAFNNLPSLIQFARTHNISQSQLIKSLGFGYKVIGGLNRPIYLQNSKVRRILVSWIIPATTDTSSFISWLNRFPGHLTLNNDILIAMGQEYLGSLRKSIFKYSDYLYSHTPSFFYGLVGSSSLWQVDIYNKVISFTNPLKYRKIYHRHLATDLYTRFQWELFQPLILKMINSLEELDKKVSPWTYVSTRNPASVLLEYLNDTPPVNILWVRIMKLQRDFGVLPFDTIGKLSRFDEDKKSLLDSTLTKMWSKWAPVISGAVRLEDMLDRPAKRPLKDPDRMSRTQVKESSMFPIAFLSRLFLTSATVSRQLGARAIFAQRARVLSLPLAMARRIGLRSIIWILFGEVITSYFVGCVLISLGYFIFLICTTSSDTPASALVILALDPMIQGALQVRNVGLNLIGTTESYGFSYWLVPVWAYTLTVVNTIMWHLPDISSISMGYMTHRYTDWASLVGFTLGVFWTYGLEPLGNLALMPVQYFYNHAPWGDIVASNEWICCWHDTYSSILSTIMSDFSMITTGLVESDYVVTSFSELDHMEAHSVDNPWSDQEEDSLQYDDIFPTPEDHAALTTPLPDSSTGSVDGLDNTFEVVDVSQPCPRSALGRMWWLIKAHPYLFSALSVTLVAKGSLSLLPLGSKLVLTSLGF